MLTTNETAIAVDVNKEVKESIEGPWQMAWKRFRKNKLAMLGGIVLIVLILCAVFAPVLSPYELDYMDYNQLNQPPNAQHWLGTDQLGRDYFTRMLHGARISLQVGVFAVLISVVLGSLVGGVAGYYGGWVDNLCMRIVEVIMSFPFLPLAITVSAVVGARLPAEYKMYITMMVIGFLSWTGLARMIRGQILSLREQEFMQAAKALGLSDKRIIVKHLLPNTVAYIIVSATLGMAGAIMTESALSFLGLGVAPPTPTWGNMVQNARDFYILTKRPWLWMPPGIAIFVTVMSINLLGDGLRDALDPKTK
ncbi:oligopeptide ABC transporter permease [Fusibacter sp. JL216-2]|uniref:oligopeptide ABC transporter permease n=1 Tax=Fusibacter sp. JL216-2 TaxID=3071453 RepID=UPI003D334E2D